MSTRIGDEAPDFTAETTEGSISFHEWLGDGWGVLFSHPRDFTPVCTTELGTVAKLKPEFEKRNTKVIALSVDPIKDHETWSADIEETQGMAPNFPLIADDNKKVADLYDMIHPNASDTATSVGASSGQRPSGPMANVPVGALLGRVGPVAVFAIGNQTTLPMPADGRLFLGVNDDQVADNHGEFAVDVRPDPRSATRR